jgi:hypothetical protein
MNKVFDEVFLVPGMVMMWSVASGDLPGGWVECNGAVWTRGNGSFLTAPDLRDRFVKGAIIQTDIETTAPGGKHIANGEKDTVIASQEVTIDNHSLTIAQMPPHTHTYERYDNRSNAGSGSSYPTRQSDIQTSSTGGSSGVVQGHNHGGRTTSKTFDNEPEHYILMFIIFVGPDAEQTTTPSPF